MEAFTRHRATSRRSIRQRSIYFAMALFLLSGCLSPSEPPKTTYYYTLTYESQGSFLNPQLPLTLRVERFSVSPPFHTRRIIYGGKGNHRNAYAYHEWISAPGEMLPYFFVRDLRKSNGFKAVLTPDTSLPATHSLHGWVEEFIEKNNDSKWKAVAKIHISLVNQLNKDPTQKIMFQKKYTASAVCKTRTPEGLAEAMGKAVAKITTSAAKDIHQRLSSTGVLTY